MISKTPLLLAVLALCTLGLSGCYGREDYYGGGYYGYPGGWGRQGWNGGYAVGPHYTGRGWGGPGYRNRYDGPRQYNRGHDHGNFNRGPGGHRP
ncbi:hypothetical protein [Asaia krungthepensis]|uniref:hypothetical protein n=1 Tax=Asaia krungthepensis TaxID=220990 RepID=UPI002231D972|nr:hypothetical protein [Asaia krungthepensis]